LLKTLVELSYEKVISIVDTAVENQLLELDSDDNKIYFAHDRIKEAFYNNLSDAEKKHLHYRIATILENKTNIEDSIFDIASHFIESGDIEKSLKYSYPAALKAKENYANTEALNYFTLTKEYLEQTQKKGTPLWTDCLVNTAQIYSAIGNIEISSELFLTALNYIDDMMEKANIYISLSGSCYECCNYTDAIKYGNMGLLLT
jgi:predicted ATPase